MIMMPSIVWTEIPEFTHACPWLGMVGIVDTQGKIHHFSGSKKISMTNEKFGDVMKAVVLELDKQNITKYKYEKAIEKADREFRKLQFSYTGNNCLDYVACVLNNMKYNGNSNHTKFTL